MNLEQRDLARHALGLPNASNRSYRNRFWTSPQHLDWSDLVSQGLAEYEPSDRADYGMFYLTRAGAEAAILPHETLCPEDFPPSDGTERVHAQADPHPVSAPKTLDSEPSNVQ